MVQKKYCKCFNRNDRIGLSVPLVTTTRLWENEQSEVTFYWHFKALTQKTSPYAVFASRKPETEHNVSASCSRCVRFTEKGKFRLYCHQFTSSNNTKVLVVLTGSWQKKTKTIYNNILMNIKRTHLLFNILYQYVTPWTIYRIIWIRPTTVYFDSVQNQY